MISYNDFLANVQVAHMQLLATFTAGERVRFPDTDAQGITDARAACAQLFSNGLLSRVAEGYELVAACSGTRSMATSNRLRWATAGSSPGSDWPCPGSRCPRPSQRAHRARGAPYPVG